MRERGTALIRHGGFLRLTLDLNSIECLSARGATADGENQLTMLACTEKTPWEKQSSASVDGTRQQSIAGMAA
jgi:hypothetical protein